MASEEDEIRNFLKSVKTHDDIKAHINYKNLLNYAEFMEAQKRVLKAHNLNFDDVAKEFREEYPDEKTYLLKAKKICVTNFVEKINLSLFNLPFETKKLKSGETLVLFEDNNKRLKIPFLLIQENEKYKFDAKTFFSTSRISEFNSLSQIENIDNHKVLDCSILTFFRPDLDYTYLIDILDLFKNTQDKKLIELMVINGAYFKSISKANSFKLVNKSIKLDSIEAKLISATLNFSINKFKEEINEENKDAYLVADNIIKNMTASEKILYLIEKNNK